MLNYPTMTSSSKLPYTDYEIFEIDGEGKMSNGCLFVVFIFSILAYTLGFLLSLVSEGKKHTKTEHRLKMLHYKTGIYESELDEFITESEK